jgi:hypothetical protein
MRRREKPFLQSAANSRFSSASPTLFVNRVSQTLAPARMLGVIRRAAETAPKIRFRFRRQSTASVWLCPPSTPRKILDFGFWISDSIHCLLFYFFFDLNFISNSLTFVMKFLARLREI